MNIYRESNPVRDKECLGFTERESVYGQNRESRIDRLFKENVKQRDISNDREPVL